MSVTLATSLSANAVTANTILTNSLVATTLTASNIFTTSNVTATAFFGDGSRLSGIGTGAISVVYAANLAPNVLVQTDASGKLANSAVTSTEVSYVSGLTSSFQTQIDAKQSSSSLPGVIASGNLTSSNVSASGNVSAAYVSGSPAGITGIVKTIALSNVQVSDNAGIVQTDLALDSASGGYVVVNGSGFGNSVPCTLLLSNASTTGFTFAAANSSTYISSSKYLCQVPALANGSYSVWMYNNNVVGTLRNAIKFSTAPSWTTAATLADVTKNVAFSTTLVATSDSAITYSNTTNLPGGVTLNANTGVLSGNITSNIGNTETFGFTVLAMDLELQKALRTFGLTAVVASATGGTVTTSGAYTIHTFATSSTFTIVAGSKIVQYIVVGGGGSGGSSAAGGGGAGGVLVGSMELTPGSYSVVIGSGGPAISYTSPYDGIQGSLSSFASAIAQGGGYGSDGTGGSGGSGGGGGWDGDTLGGAATTGQGYAGGVGLRGPASMGAGGGGAGSVGGNAGSNVCGSGGTGYDTGPFRGLTTARIAGGGGGGGNGIQGATLGTAVDGGGLGSISNTGVSAQSGISGTGGGGGGSSGATSGAGGSGIVFLKYMTTVITSATGGTITYSGAYKIHTFTTSGTFTVTSGGSVEYLLVAGGGGAGSGNNTNCGGGGGGGVLASTGLSLTAQTYTIVIGSGGVASTGSDSTAFGLVAKGGGRSGITADVFGDAGGCGGGGSTKNPSPTGTGGTGTSGQGYAGGAAYASPSFSGGGGGGAGGGGASATSAGGGAGGVGMLSTITGTATYYAGGGAGHGGDGYNNPVGGNGGGGAVDTSGTSNTGGGAGGGKYNTSNTTGGSGIVIIRYFS
jgi:hypothetical protein